MPPTAAAAAAEEALDVLLRACAARIEESVPAESFTELCSTAEAVIAAAPATSGQEEPPPPAAGIQLVIDAPRILFLPWGEDAVLDRAARARASGSPALPNTPTVFTLSAHSPSSPAHLAELGWLVLFGLDDVQRAEVIGAVASAASNLTEADARLLFERMMFAVPSSAEFTRPSPILPTFTGVLALIAAVFAISLGVVLLARLSVAVDPVEKSKQRKSEAKSRASARALGAEPGDELSEKLAFLKSMSAGDEGINGAVSAVATAERDAAMQAREAEKARNGEGGRRRRRGRGRRAEGGRPGSPTTAPSPWAAFSMGGVFPDGGSGGGGGGAGFGAGGGAL